MQRYYDATEETSFDLLSCVDRPTLGWTSFSTIGIHEARNDLEGSDIRVELAGVASTASKRFANTLGDMGLRIIKDGWLAAPGVVFPWVSRDSGLSIGLPHVMLAPPFPWPGLSKVRIDAAPDVHWLLAVPISEPEYAWLLDNGYFEFEKLFEARGVEYFDTERKSVV